MFWHRTNIKNFFDPKIYNLIKSNPVLGGEKKSITILYIFFNPIDDQYEISKLPKLFAKSINMLLNLNATIENFYGLSILAYYNFPKEDSTHAVTACNTAFELISLAKKFGSKIIPTIGIHTGTVFIGNIGSSEMMMHKIISDNVDITIEIASSNISCESNILCSDYTQNLISNHYRLKKKGLIGFQKKEILIFEVIEKVGSNKEHF